jgi:hypothetical protein
MKRTWSERIGYDHILANAGPWYYILKGSYGNDKVDFVTADVLCEVGNELILYRGFVNTGFMNEKGNLERLILDEVERVPFNPNDSSLGIFKPHTVAGDNFVIYSSSIKNINLNFIRLDPDWNFDGSAELDNGTIEQDPSTDSPSVSAS